MQKIMMIGRLGKDHEMRYTTSGDAEVNCSGAVDDGYGDKKTVEWFNCIAWKKTAENCHQYLSKGSKIYGEGVMKTRSWNDKDGQKRYATEAVLYKVEFLSEPNRGANASKNEPNNRPDNRPNQGGFDPDDVPF